MKPFLFLTIGAAVLLTPFALAIADQQGEHPSAANALTKPVLTFDHAHAAARAAIEFAKAHGAGGAIAVVDDGGHLICLHRIDGTFPAAANVAAEKARTAAVFRKPTQDFEIAIKGGRTSLTAVPQMLPLEGGVPIVIDGQVVGGIGCSGAKSSTQDVEVASAGAAALATMNP